MALFHNPVFTYSVTGNEQKKSEEFILDKKVKKVNKMLIQSDHPDLANIRMLFGMTINDLPVFKAGQPLQTVGAFDTAIPPDFRYVTLNKEEGYEANNQKVVFDFEDVDVVGTTYEDYKLYISFECEI